MYFNSYSAAFYFIGTYTSLNGLDLEKFNYTIGFLSGFRICLIFRRFFFQFSNNTQVPGHMAAAYYTSLGAAAVFVQHIAKATHFPLEEAIGQGILHFA